MDQGELTHMIQEMIAENALIESVSSSQILNEPPALIVEDKTGKRFFILVEELAP